MSILLRNLQLQSALLFGDRITAWLHGWQQWDGYIDIVSFTIVLKYTSQNLWFISQKYCFWLTSNLNAYCSFGLTSVEWLRFSSYHW